MTTPIVTEISRPLEPVSRDTFISALARSSSTTSTAAAATAYENTVRDGSAGAPVKGGRERDTGARIKWAPRGGKAARQTP